MQKRSFNWMAGLVILIEKEDPTFTLIKSLTPALRVLAPGCICLALFETDVEGQDAYFKQLIAIFEPRQADSVNARRIVEKLNLHFAHQEMPVVAPSLVNEIQQAIRRLALTPTMIKAEQCADVYSQLSAMLSTESLGHAETSFMNAIIFLVLVAGTTREVFQYLERRFNKKQFTLTELYQATNFSIPQQSTWTPHIWQSLFRNNKPIADGDLFFKLLAQADKIEKYYQDNHKEITPKTPLTVLATVAAKCLYAADAFPEAYLSLYFQHGVKKEQLDWYRSLVINEDESDIPDVVIEGSEISDEHSPYCLAKIKKTDLIIPIIGNLTGCCEAIDKPGAAYVHVALTQSFAGYYVLYDKRKTKNEGVVGHCIAWRVNNTIVYSSVETNINYRQHLPLFADMYYLLTKVLMLAHGIEQVYVYEWHDNTPPFIGVTQEAPGLRALINETAKRLSISYHLVFQTICIAEARRPYLSLYAKLRHFPLLAWGLKSADIPFTNDELISIVHLLSLSAKNFDLSAYFVKFGLTKRIVAENTKAFHQVILLTRNTNIGENEVSFVECFRLLERFSVKHCPKKSIPYLALNASAIYTWYLTVNRVFQAVATHDKLTTSILSGVINSFEDDPSNNVLFVEFDLYDSDTHFAKLRKLFYFCSQVAAFYAVFEENAFSKSAFNSLYDIIHRVNPAILMQKFLMAIRHKQDEQVYAFLNKNIAMNECYGYSHSPLGCAVEWNRLDLVVTFLRKGADVNLCSAGHLSDGGLRPLEAAAEMGFDDIFAYLMQAPTANPCFITKIDKANLLHSVPALKDSAWVPTLVARGVDINHVSAGIRFKSGGHTPLYEAARLRRSDMFQVMLECGANVNQKNAHGNTMLHVAILNRRPDIVRLFLSANAQCSIKNNEGLTAYELAKQLNQTPLARKEMFDMNERPDDETCTDYASMIFQLLTTHLQSLNTSAPHLLFSQQHNIMPYLSACNLKITPGT